MSSNNSSKLENENSNIEKPNGILELYKKGKEIDPILLAEACQQLYSRHGTGKEAAKNVPVSASTIAEWRRITNLPEYAQILVSQDKIPKQVALEIEKIEKENLQRRLTWLVVDEEVSRNRLKYIITEINAGKDLEETLTECGIEQKSHIIGITLDRNDYDRFRIMSLLEGEDKEEEYCQELIRKVVRHYEKLGEKKIQDLINALEIFGAETSD